MIAELDFTKASGHSKKLFAKVVANPEQCVMFPSSRPIETIYVDPATQSYRGTSYCHLFSDSIPHLHAFAARLGLKREWFQQPPKASWMHYDTTWRNRLKAIELGAVSVDQFEIILVAHRQRGTLTQKIIEQVEFSRSLRQPVKMHTIPPKLTS